MNVLERRACALFASLLLALGTLGTLACRPATDDGSRIALGRRHYQVYGCGACHGPEGHGDGPSAAHLRVAPRDFRDGGAFRQGHSVEQIARTIGEGVPSSGSAMPAAPFIPPQERRELALYIQSLAPSLATSTGKD